MSAARLVALYPRRWRERYGEELADVIRACSDGGRVPWRVRADVVLGACRERLRAGGGAPAERARGGALLVLWAWALFVVAGGAVGKLSEQWQQTTAGAGHAVASTAFDALIVGAVCASALMLAGIGATLPSVAALLRGGGWVAIRRSFAVAALLSLVAAGATVALVAWAHGLTASERNGRDVAYGIAFLAWGALVAAALLAWTAAAAVTARRLRLPAGVLRAEARLAVAVAIAMAAMTTATTVWWAALPSAQAWVPAAVGLMLAATLLGAAGVRRVVST